MPPTNFPKLVVTQLAGGTVVVLSVGPSVALVVSVPNALVPDQELPTPVLPKFVLTHEVGGTVVELSPGVKVEMDVDKFEKVLIPVHVFPVNKSPKLV